CDAILLVCSCWPRSSSPTTPCCLISLASAQRMMPLVPVHHTSPDQYSTIPIAISVSTRPTLRDARLLLSILLASRGDPSDRGPSLSAIIVSMNLAGRISLRPQRCGSDRRVEFEYALSKAHQFIGAGDNGCFHFGPVGWINISGSEHAMQFLYGSFNHAKLVTDLPLLDK